MVIKEFLDKAKCKPKDCKSIEFPTNIKEIAKPKYIIAFDKNSNTILAIEYKQNKKITSQKIYHTNKNTL